MTTIDSRFIPANFQFDLTSQETEVQTQIGELNAMSPDDVLTKYGDLRVKKEAESVCKGNIEPARDYYERGFNRSYYVRQVGSLALGVAYGASTLPSKIYEVARLLYQGSEGRDETLFNREVSELKEAAKIVFLGTLCLLKDVVLMLLLDIPTLIYRYIDRTFINSGPRAAILIVDPQFDFFPKGKFSVNSEEFEHAGGTLGVPGAWETIPVINELQDKFQGNVISCADNHPLTHGATLPMLREKGPYPTPSKLDGEEQTAWPVHCVQGSRGQKYVPTLNTQKIERVFAKGEMQRIDSYSAVYDNGKKNKHLTAEYLKEALGVTDVFVVGLAYEFCVGFSALDLAEEGFNVTVVEDGTASVDFLGSKAAMTQKLTDKKVTIVQSKDLLGGKNSFFKA